MGRNQIKPTGECKGGQRCAMVGRASRLERAGNQREEAEEKGEKGGGRDGAFCTGWMAQFLAGPALRTTTYQRSLSAGEWGTGRYIT